METMMLTFKIDIDEEALPELVEALTEAAKKKARHLAADEHKTREIGPLLADWPGGWPEGEPNITTDAEKYARGGKRLLKASLQAQGEEASDMLIDTLWSFALEDARAAIALAVESVDRAEGDFRKGKEQARLDDLLTIN